MRKEENYLLAVFIYGMIRNKKSFISIQPGGFRNMNEKKDKNLRTLDMYVRLCEGKIINKTEEAVRFGVDERSVQRDIDDIRMFLDERVVENPGDSRKVEYSRAKKGFVMTGMEASLMTNSEILAVSKILLESRAFTKKEMGILLDKMIAGCVPQKNMKMVSDLISNEKFHYVELHNKTMIHDKLWEIGTEVKESNLIEISYRKPNAEKEVVKRVVQPLAIIFSEYYFYLNANIVKQSRKTGKYVPIYDYPAIFRIDRIIDYRQMGEKFKIAYANRFEEGEFRKRVQFMFAGKLTRLQFKYTGGNLEAIMDRLPTAKVVSEDEEAYLIEAEVYGKGILMWLLSQGSMVEVIRPKELRDEMVNTLTQMLEKYH